MTELSEMRALIRRAEKAADRRSENETQDRYGSEDISLRRRAPEEPS